MIIVDGVATYYSQALSAACWLKHEATIEKIVVEQGVGTKSWIILPQCLPIMKLF